MEQATISNPVAPRVWSTRLNHALAGISAICLLSVFAINGTFSSIFNSSQPQGGNTEQAAAGPVFKTTKTTAVSDVVTKALAFKALLTTAQQATLEQTYTTTLARKWSNLPCGATCRNGIQFGTLSSAQLAAALDLIKAATGTTTNDGFEEFDQNRLAEAYLHANGGGSGYDSTLRWIAFLNTPSTTGGWMLQFGGHHYAANIAFNAGHVIGATPFFQGLEPLSFTWGSTTYAPLNDEHDALTAMLASFSASELATAKLTSTFSDVTMSPGETNGGTGTFPSTKVGIACSSLTSAQKDLVIAAIRHYTQDVDDVTAAVILARYTSEIDGTYIAFTGSGTSGSASSFLNANSNYVRIDGPTVWIELACQNGVVFPSQIHYHTVWRDHSHDYGLDLSGPAIDDASTSGVTEVAAANTVSIYPNPTSDQVSITTGQAVTDADIVAVSAATGQRITLATHQSGTAFQVNVAALPTGIYMVQVRDAHTTCTSRLCKQ